MTVRLRPLSPYISYCIPIHPPEATGLFCSDRFPGLEITEIPPSEAWKRLYLPQSAAVCISTGANTCVRPSEQQVQHGQTVRPSCGPPLFLQNTHTIYPINMASFWVFQAPQRDPLVVSCTLSNSETCDRALRISTWRSCGSMAAQASHARHPAVENGHPGIPSGPALK